VDQDSGRGTGRSEPRHDNGHHRPDVDRPSSVVANPLPRRKAQDHIEPQLRTPGGAGTGTAFAAFTAFTALVALAGAEDDSASGAMPNASDDTAADRAAAASTDDGAESSAAAEFHEGAGRGRRDRKPPHR